MYQLNYKIVWDIPYKNDLTLQELRKLKKLCTSDLKEQTPLKAQRPRIWNEIISICSPVISFKLIARYTHLHYLLHDYIIKHVSAVFIKSIERYIYHTRNHFEDFHVSVTFLVISPVSSRPSTRHLIQKLEFSHCLKSKT